MKKICFPKPEQAGVLNLKQFWQLTSGGNLKSRFVFELLCVQLLLTILLFVLTIITIHLQLYFSILQKIRGARKFRHSGIDPALCCKYNIMFTNIMATGQYVWAHHRLSILMMMVQVKGERMHLMRIYIQRKVVVIPRRILYQILQRMSILWLLV